MSQVEMLFLSQSMFNIVAVLILGTYLSASLCRVHMTCRELNFFKSWVYLEKFLISVKKFERYYMAPTNTPISGEFIAFQFS